MIGQIPNSLTPACVPACALLAAGRPITPVCVFTSTGKSAGRSVSQRENENFSLPAGHVSQGQAGIPLKRSESGSGIL